ncbi:MAG: SOS response-associated peptidase [Hyphomicrobiaceae bacterium]|nr:SOS response-associated peptidase [Hyphomicrobiaceae bacterium]
MCGRFTYKFTWQEIHDHLAGFVEVLKKEAGPGVADAPPRYNIAPTQPIIVFRREGGTVQAELMRWGLVPEWVKDPKDFPLIVNARSETLKEKASFRNPLKNKRCIIPASGYYEWLRRPDGSKTPHYITNRDDSPMLFAGLWSTWMGPDGEEVDTATIITVPANPELAEIHDRSPALLSGDDISKWLDTASVNADKAHAILKPVPPGTTKQFAVSPRVNSARNEGEDLIVPVFDSARPKPPVEASPSGSKPPKKSQLDLF